MRYLRDNMCSHEPRKKQTVTQNVMDVSTIPDDIALFAHGTINQIRLQQHIEQNKRYERYRDHMNIGENNEVLNYQGRQMHTLIVGNREEIYRVMMLYASSIQSE